MKLNPRWAITTKLIIDLENLTAIQEIKIKTIITRNYRLKNVKMKCFTLFLDEA